MKQKLRKELLQIRDTLTKEELAQHSNIVCEQLLPYLKGCVGIYRSIGSELDVCNLETLSSITLAYPKTYSNHTIRFFKVTCEEDFVKGPYDIMEPRDTCEEVIPDMLVVPLVGFDEEGNRLGHGLGYYDRYLQSFKGLKIGVAHECQRVEHVYEEAHDIKLDIVIHEKQRYESINQLYKKSAT